MSVQCEKGCEQVLAVVISVECAVNTNDHWPGTEAGVSVWPLESQVMTMNLNESAVVAVPDDALDSALWTLSQPRAQLMKVNRWGVSDSNTPM